jgi:Zn-dependent protease
MFTTDELIMAAWLAVPLLFSLTIHEYSHARVALAFGDDTAKRMGRVSLNPLRHLDLLGTVAIFIIHFGWAKPVPVNPMNLRPRRLGQVAVSFAGPGSNIMFAFLPPTLLNQTLSTFSTGEVITPADILFITVLVNLALAVFNMIPLFPLDGHHILREALPPEHQYEYMKMQILYGRWMLLAIIFLPRLLDKRGPLGYLFEYLIFPAALFLLGGTPS